MYSLTPLLTWLLQLQFLLIPALLVHLCEERWGLGELMTEGAYSLNRKSTSKQALVVRIKTCFAFTGFYCAFHKHANSEVQ